MDMLVGGFGKLHHVACPGIEQLVLDAGGDNSGDAKVLRRERLLSDAPSPTGCSQCRTAAC